MRILLTGADGFIGRHIKPALIAAGHELVSFGRRTGGDFNDLRAAADWREYLTGAEAVINSVGIIAESRGQSFSVLHTCAPAALFHACTEAGVRRVIQISALGADGRAVTRYHKTKKAADDMLRGLPLDWFVLRPSLVYGPDGRSAALFRSLAALPVIPVVDHGRQQIQPVHVDDLVATVLLCLTAEPARRTIDVVGPQALEFADWLQRLRFKSGRSAARVVSTPYPLARLASRLTEPIFPLLSPDVLRMLQQGNTADVRPLSNFLGRMPRDLP
jgi:uncharacterized protein YbjT (DUF2867 family)